MSQQAPGQEEGVVEVQIPTDEEYALMTEEQRNADIMGEEIEWTDEQKETLNKAVQEPAPAPGSAPEVQSVLDSLDKTIENEALIESRVQSSPSHQKLRQRAQAAEEKLKTAEENRIRLEAENRAYKESFTKMGPEKEYDLNDPDDLDQYLKDKKDELGTAEPPPKPEYEVIPDAATIASHGARFVDAAGNVLDGKVDNPNGKPYFRVRDAAGSERVVFDREALTEYDTSMATRFGTQLYTQMWGTPNQPGVMSHWRDKAPTHEVMAVLNSEDPVLATLQVFKNIVASLANQQGQKPSPTPQAPVRKDIRQAPRGFGAAPFTESDAPSNVPTPLTISDQQLDDMSEEQRNAWLARED